MPISEEAREIVEDALRRLDRSHMHGDGEVEELRSRVDILAEMVRELLKVKTD